MRGVINYSATDLFAFLTEHFVGVGLFLGLWNGCEFLQKKDLKGFEYELNISFKLKNEKKTYHKPFLYNFLITEIRTLALIAFLSNF